MPDKRESGRRVYHRLDGGGEGSAREGRGGGPAEAARPSELGGVSLARTLAPLLVGFALLIGLVFGLGALSRQQVQSVSSESLNRERRLNETLTRLFRLRIALNRLDHEARTRGQQESRGGIRPPGDFPLNSARDEVKDALPLYDQLPLAQTERGRALRRNVDDFLEITRDPRAYNERGYTANREIERQLTALFVEASGERESIGEAWSASIRRAREQINFLRLLAVATGLLVAIATIWEVLRRFRQLRVSFEDVRRERQFNRQMLEGMVSAIAALDGRDRLRSANASFREIFPEARAGQPLLESVTAPEATRLLAAAISTRVSASTYRGRWRLPRTGDGEEPGRVFDVYSSPLEIDGEPGQIITLVDVTEAAESERELRQQESLAAVGQAAAQLAHEIKNPLGSIRLGVAMLRDMTGEREAITTIDLVERGIEHLSKLTSDVTQFSRQRRLALSEIELHELLDESLDLVSDKFRDRVTPVEREFPDRPIHATWDADQLRQVFVNLLANAADASPSQQPVTLRTARVEGRVGDAREGARAGMAQFARIEVADRGPGMDAATRRRIFEPFFTTKKKGTGLGLAIAKQIVEAHGGRIHVESNPGHGTRFIVELPLNSQTGDE